MCVHLGFYRYIGEMNTEIMIQKCFYYLCCNLKGVLTCNSAIIWSLIKKMYTTTLTIYFFEWISFAFQYFQCWYLAFCGRSANCTSKRSIMLHWLWCVYFHTQIFFSVNNGLYWNYFDNFSFSNQNRIDQTYVSKKIAFQPI